MHILLIHAFMDRAGLPVAVAMTVLWAVALLASATPSREFWWPDAS